MNRKCFVSKIQPQFLTHSDCLPDGSGGHIRIDRTAVRPVGQSPTATNAHDPVTSERGGPSPYRAVEPWLLLLYDVAERNKGVIMYDEKERHSEKQRNY
jgi:hypothetical protein